MSDYDHPVLNSLMICGIPSELLLGILCFRRVDAIENNKLKGHKPYVLFSYPASRVTQQQLIKVLHDTYK